MTQAKKKQLGIRLKRAIKASKKAMETERQLAELTEDIFGCNWSEVDADGIIDILAGYSDEMMDVDDFIKLMEEAKQMKG